MDLSEDAEKALHEDSIFKISFFGADFWVHTLTNVFESLEALGLSIPIPKPEPKKRGRRPKPKNQTEMKPKRPRGRPRKNSITSAKLL